MNNFLKFGCLCEQVNIRLIIIEIQTLFTYNSSRYLITPLPRITSFTYIIFIIINNYKTKTRGLHHIVYFSYLLIFDAVIVL